MDYFVYKIRFFIGNKPCKSIVLADSYEEAKSILKREYKEYDILIEIDEYEVVDEKGIALTWYGPEN